MKEVRRIIEYIYEMCKEHNCNIDFSISPDGAMVIKVYGKRRDFIVIGANWDEEIIKESINDTIRRACND